MSVVRVGAYCRVSSGKQLEGDSLGDQQTRINLRAQSENWQIVHTYVEQAEVGWNDDRPELQNLMLDAHAHRFDLIIATI
jgi:DNA invertase Pin-like site-specific DNA recombinase